MTQGMNPAAIGVGEAAELDRLRRDFPGFRFGREVIGHGAQAHVHFIASALCGSHPRVVVRHDVFELRPELEKP